MKLNHPAGAVLLALALAAVALGLGLPPGQRTGAYIVAAVFGVLGLWRLLTRKGH